MHTRARLHARAHARTHWAVRLQIVKGVTVQSSELIVTNETVPIVESIIVQSNATIQVSAAQRNAVQHVATEYNSRAGRLPYCHR